MARRRPTRRRRERTGLSFLVVVCAVITIVLPIGVALLAKPRAGPSDPGTLVSVYVKTTGRVLTMALEDYLVGVVASEMPASFEPEALKAQAVAARTYTMRKLEEDQKTPGAPAKPGHMGALMCSDPGCCQAWSSRDDLVRKWGSTDYVRNIVRVVQAVAATHGMVLHYGGKLIDAVYHACCGGATEDAAAVWGRSVPYLVPTACICAEHGYAQVEQRSVRQSDLIAALSSYWSGGAVPALAQGVRVSSTTTTNRAKTLSVFGTNVNATDIRKALSLRSTAMSVSSGGDLVNFSTIGYGHGVGMCQWGARAYAIRGWSFHQILTHYYRGVALVRVSSSQGG
jgi:stage II sporulation protein D